MKQRIRSELQVIRRRLARSHAQLLFRDLALHVGRNNPHVVREDLARRYLSGCGIEIGAGHLPLRVPRRVRVRHVDNLDRAALIAHTGAGFLGRGVDVAAIPVIDLIDDAQTLRNMTDRSADFVIANHVLEHLEDPIAALQSFLRVTREHGTVFLTLPDARHTFDRSRERTTIRHLISDHDRGPQISRERHYAEWATHIEGIGPAGVPARAAEYAATNARHHFHVWELDGFLGFLAAIDLECDLVHAQMNQKEFAIILRKT